MSQHFDGTRYAEVMRWRKAERQRLIGERLAVAPEQRLRWTEQLAAHLDTAAGELSGLTVSAYWPFRGEPDLRPWMRRVSDRGGQCALPVVVEKHTPLIFRNWTHGDPLERGVWNIPIPAGGGEANPDIVIAPIVGFDLACFRLGYGGGFFDRTLAAMKVRPKIIGAGYWQAAIATIHPQPHDIAMDMIVTEQGIFRPAEAG